MPYIGSSPPAAPVTTLDITDGSIANTDMDTSSITPHALASGAVTAGKIATGGVSANTQLASGVVTTHALSAAAVTLAKSDNAIITYDLAVNAGFDIDNLPESLTANTIYSQFILGRDITIESEVGYIDTAGVSTDGNTHVVTLDVEQNGSSIYSAKPYFANNVNTITSGTLSTSNLSSGDRITVRCTQVGANTAGSGVRLTIKARLR